MVNIMDILWISLKVIIIYFILVILLRFLGKREVGQLSIFDLVIILIIADVASIGIDNNEFFLPSLLCLLILAILQKLVSKILLHNGFLRQVFEGKSTIIVYEGKLFIKNMKKENLLIDDLISQMRLNKISDINQIRLAVLENNGLLSIIKKQDENKIYTPLIFSGQLIKENFALLNINKQYLIEYLKMFNIKYKKLLYLAIKDDELLFYSNDKKTKALQGNKLKLERNNIKS